MAAATPRAVPINSTADSEQATKTRAPTLCEPTGITHELDQVAEPLLRTQKDGLTLQGAAGTKVIGERTNGSGLGTPFILAPAMPKIARLQQRRGAIEMRFSKIGRKAQRLIQMAERVIEPPLMFQDRR